MLPVLLRCMYHVTRLSFAAYEPSSRRASSNTAADTRENFKSQRMVYSYGAQQWRAAPWAKVQALWNATFHYDWVVWVDSDGVFPRAEWGLGYLLAAMDPQHHVLLYSDMPYNTLRPNTGMIVLRGGAPARRLLRHWWETTADLPLGHPFDQRHLVQMLSERGLHLGRFTPELAAMVVQVELVQCANNFPQIAFPPAALMEVSYFVQFFSDFEGDRASAIDRTVARWLPRNASKAGCAASNRSVSTSVSQTMQNGKQARDHPAWVRHVDWDSIARAVHDS